MRESVLLDATAAARVLGGISARTLRDRAQRANLPSVGGEMRARRYVAPLRVWRALATPAPKPRGQGGRKPKDSA